MNTLQGDSVLAAYRDLERASHAVDLLQERGFGDEQLSVLGESPDEVDLNRERESQEPLDGDVVEQAAAGGAAGSAVGALLGAGGTAAVVSMPGVGMAAGTGALVGAVAGAVGGGTVGSIAVGEAAVRTQQGWRQTFRSLGALLSGGGVVVGVHAEDPGERTRAHDLLASTAPADLRRLDQEGRKLPSAPPE